MEITMDIIRQELNDDEIKDCIIHSNDYQNALDTFPNCNTFWIGIDGYYSDFIGYELYYDSEDEDEINEVIYYVHFDDSDVGIFEPVLRRKKNLDLIIGL